VIAIDSLRKSPVNVSGGRHGVGRPSSTYERIEVLTSLWSRVEVGLQGCDDLLGDRSILRPCVDPRVVQILL